MQPTNVRVRTPLPPDFLKRLWCFYQLLRENVHFLTMKVLFSPLEEFSGETFSNVNSFEYHQVLWLEFQIHSKKSESSGKKLSYIDHNRKLYNRKVRNQVKHINFRLLHLTLFLKSKKKRVIRRSSQVFEKSVIFTKSLLQVL